MKKRRMNLKKVSRRRRQSMSGVSSGSSNNNKKTVEMFAQRRLQVSMNNHHQPFEFTTNLLTIKRRKNGKKYTKIAHSHSHILGWLNIYVLVPRLSAYINEY